MTKKKPSEKDEGFLVPHLGPVIFEARMKAKLSQEQLAKRAGTSDATVRRIETKLGSIRPQLLKSLCEVLGLNYTDVVTQAMIKTWRALHGREDVGPLEHFRGRILARFDARNTGDRVLLEEFLDYAAFLLVGMQKEPGGGSPL